MEVSFSPALSDTDSSEGTISFNRSDENACKYPENSRISSTYWRMQPILSNSSNSDKSVTCNNSSNNDFKKPLPLKSEFLIKPVAFYNSFSERSNNDDDSAMNKSSLSVETLTQVSSRQNSLNDTDLCDSQTRKTKSSGFRRKQSHMINSYVFEATLDETSLNNTNNKSITKFTFRRKKILQDDENIGRFSEAFNSQNSSVAGEDNESSEDTKDIRENSFDSISTQNRLIERNIRTGFKRNVLPKHNDKRFSEAFNDSEITKHDISQDSDNTLELLSEHSQTEEISQNYGNFCKGIRNSKQMVTSRIFQDVFSETDSSKASISKDTENENFSSKVENFLHTICNEQATQNNECLEYSGSNSLHKNSTAEVSVQNDFKNTEEKNAFDNVIISDPISQSHSFNDKNCTGIYEKRNLEEKLTSDLQESESLDCSQLKENEQHNKTPFNRSFVSVATLENEPFKETKNDTCLQNFDKDTETSTKNLSDEISHKKTDTVNRESYGNIDKSLSISQDTVHRENAYVNNIVHKICTDGMNTLERKENDQAHLDNSERFEIPDDDDNKRMLIANKSSAESKFGHSSNKDSFCLEIQEEPPLFAKQICEVTSAEERMKPFSGDVYEVDSNNTERSSNLEKSTKENVSNEKHVKNTQTCNKNISVPLHTDAVDALDNSETSEGQGTLGKETVKDSIVRLSQADDNSLADLQSLIYEESESRTREEISDRTSELFEFHASKSLRFCSLTRSSVYSNDRDLSKQNADLSKTRADSVTRSQITDTSGTALNSLNNSLISTVDEGESEISIDNSHEATEMHTLNDSTITTDNVKSVQDTSSLVRPQNMFIESDKYNVEKEDYATKSLLQESSSSQTQVDKPQSLKSRTITKSNNNSTLTPRNDSNRKRKRSECLGKNTVPRKSRKLSNQSKEIKNMSSIMITPAKNTNESSTQKSIMTRQSTKKKHSDLHILENMSHETSLENYRNPVFTLTTENKSSDCSYKFKLYSESGNRNNQSQTLRKPLKNNSQSNQKQEENSLSINTDRSRNHLDGSTTRRKKLMQVNQVSKVGTELMNSNTNLDAIKDSAVDIDINRTLQHDESNDDNGYDVGCNTFSSTNIDYTPCNEAVINRRTHKRKLSALRKCLLNSIISQNEADARDTSIPFSELCKRKKKKLLNKENRCVADNSFTDNTFIEGPSVIKNKNNKNVSHHGNWVTKTMKDYLISKLKPKYGLKANWRCQQLVDFMARKVNETIENSSNYNVPVDEIKLELARLNIIVTNLDFYMFVLKYFRQYERDFVFKSVPCIQTFGRPNLVPRPPNSYLRENIL